MATVAASCEIRWLLVAIDLRVGQARQLLLHFLLDIVVWSVVVLLLLQLISVVREELAEDEGLLSFVSAAAPSWVLRRRVELVEVHLWVLNETDSFAVGGVWNARQLGLICALSLLLIAHPGFRYLLMRDFLCVG